MTYNGTCRDAGIGGANGCLVHPIPTGETMYAHQITNGKVRTFWETHKIWKNLPDGFDKSADLLSKRQNHEEDFFKLCVLLKKSEL